MLLGIEDPYVWSALVLCILSMILCAVYGALKWNHDDEKDE